MVPTRADQMPPATPPRRGFSVMKSQERIGQPLMTT